MAKKRKKRYSSRKSGKRMSGIGAVDFMNIIAVAGGAVVAGFANKLVPSTVNDKIVSGGKIALGVALPMLSKDGKTKALLNGVGSGMIAVGAVELLKSFGVLSGIGADTDTISVSLDGIGEDDTNFLGESVLAESVLAEDLGAIDDLSVVNGIDDLSVVNGIDDLNVVNGIDEDMYY